MLLRIIALAIIPAISGCLYIPAIDKEPRFEKHLGELGVGSTTKEELFLIAGEPDITRENGSIAIYDNSRITGYFIMLEPAIYNPIEELGSTLIQLKGNVVTLISPLSDGYGCYANDVCLDSGWTTIGGPRLAPEMTGVSSAREDDRKAKSFSALDDGCNVYVYTVGDVHAVSPVLVSIADKELVPLNLSNYLNLKVPYGKFGLKVFHSGTSFVTANAPELLYGATINCSKSSVDFLEVSYKLGEGGPNTRSASVSLIGHEKARAEVFERRLLLLP